MKIKWNWGTGITIAIILFMSLILYFVYLTTQNPIQLVEKDYYPKGLVYQQRIEQIKNARKYESDFYVLETEKEVVIHLPAINPDTGNLQIFRPSDKALDIVSEINPDTSGLMHFPSEKFRKGKYIIKVFWKENDTGYYLEKNFYFK